jgi:hypothetical protein
MRFTSRGLPLGTYGVRRCVDRDCSNTLQARRSETT